MTRRSSSIVAALFILLAMLFCIIVSVDDADARGHRTRNRGTRPPHHLYTTEFTQ